MRDASFKDGGELPLRLKAETAEDLPILASLLQDAVFTGADMKWSAKARRFDLLVNRFRWEDLGAAQSQGRPPERVRTVLSILDVTGLAGQGFTKGDADTILSLLSLTFLPAEDGTGQIELVLAGDGGIRLQVECVNLQLADVTRPYSAPSGKAPSHPDL